MDLYNGGMSNCPKHGYVERPDTTADECPWCKGVESVVTPFKHVMVTRCQGCPFVETSSQHYPRCGLIYVPHRVSGDGVHEDCPLRKRALIVYLNLSEE